MFKKFEVCLNGSLIFPDRRAGLDRNGIIHFNLTQSLFNQRLQKF